MSTHTPITHVHVLSIENDRHVSVVILKVRIHEINASSFFSFACVETRTLFLSLIVVVVVAVVDDDDLMECFFSLSRDHLARIPKSRYDRKLFTRLAIAIKYTIFTSSLEMLVCSAPLPATTVASL